MSPTIASLSNELLIEIFQYCILLPTYNIDFHNDLRFLLIAVCRDWRTLITNAPLLWKTIEINDRSIIPCPLRNIHIHAGAIFYRPCIAFRCARDLSVNLTINLPINPKGFNLNHCALLAKILYQEAPRIASLAITGGNWKMQLRVLRGLKNQDMPHLHSFTHDAYSGDDISEWEGFGEAFPILQYPFRDENTNLDTVNQWGRELYPNLTHLEIIGAPYNFDLLPTSGLRRLGLHYLPTQVFPHRVIRKMLSYSADTLEDLWLMDSLHYEEGEQMDHADHVVLSKLKKLSIDYDDPITIANFLPLIRAPVLEQLDISDSFIFYGGVQEDSSDDMLRAMMHSLPLNRLQKLMISGVMFKDEIAIPERDAFLVKGQVPPFDVPITLRFLASLESLTSLFLRVREGTERIMHLLNYPRASSFGTDGEALHDGAMQVPSRYLAHLPSLECLHLMAIHPDRSVLVQQFMDDRVHNAVHEKRLHLIIEDSFESDDIPARDVFL